MKSLAAIAICWLCLLCTGCDVPFSPKGDYFEKVVVYSILDPTKKSQYARVYFTYNVEGVDPRKSTIDPQVRNALVTVYDEAGQSYVFRDTLVKRDTSERYSSDIVAYYADRLAPSPEKRYRLEISIPEYGNANAAVTVPEPFIIYVNGSRARPLLADSSDNLCDCIPVSLFGGNGAKGHLTRFFLDYTVKKEGGQEVTRRKEVPIFFQKFADGTVKPVYPQPDRSTYIEFSKRLFSAIVSDILSSDPSAEIHIQDATFISYAMEPNLYNYYLIAHGFSDPFSVRLDLPDFTNIQNGLGVFGAVAVDSLTLPIR